MSEIDHHIPLDTLSNVVPRQPALVGRYTIFIGSFDVPLIIFSCIVVLNAGVLVHRREERMLLRVIAAVANIESTDKGLALINNHEFSVVGP